ncbi:MAG: rhodanese-like domain-containing protein, partial [Rubrobacteraceae bacterium]
EAETVVYCSNPACVASRAAYKMLTQHGYTDVRRYAGGLEDWDAAGYALEGEPKTFRPVILAVDDEPRELERVETELRKRYAEDYRVVGEGSAEAASGKLPTTQAPTQVPTQTSERT